MTQMAWMIAPTQLLGHKHHHHLSLASVPALEMGARGSELGGLCSRQEEEHDIQRELDIASSHAEDSKGWHCFD